jgi:hypothetical protein
MARLYNPRTVSASAFLGHDVRIWGIRLACGDRIAAEWQERSFRSELGVICIQPRKKPQNFLWEPFQRLRTAWGAPQKWFSEPQFIRAIPAKPPSVQFSAATSVRLNPLVTGRPEPGSMLVPRSPRARGRPGEVDEAERLVVRCVGLLRP